MLSVLRTNVRFMNDTGRKSRTWTDDQLVAAVAVQRSWRGVCRSLGLRGTSAGVLRTVKRHAERLRLDTAHFSQRTWSDRELCEAVAAASTWSDALSELGLTDRGETRVRVKGHAVRLGLDVSHLNAQPAERSALDGHVPPGGVTVRVGLRGGGLPVEL
jgi:hypothetical protein